MKNELLKYIRFVNYIALINIIKQNSLKFCCSTYKIFGVKKQSSDTHNTSFMSRKGGYRLRIVVISGLSVCIRCLRTVLVASINWASSFRLFAVGRRSRSRRSNSSCDSGSGSCIISHYTQIHFNIY